LVLLMIFSMQASADHPSLVRPHWRSALAATVTLVTVRCCRVGRDDAMRATLVEVMALGLAGTVEGWRSSAIGRPGLSEGVSSCGDRATV